MLETRKCSSIDVELVSKLYQVDGAKVVQCQLRDITDRRQAEARIRYMALHDALTGLPNRTLFEDRLSSALSQSRRSLKQVAVLLLDLDRFKHINDSLGHHIGGQFLEAVATRLPSCELGSASWRA